MKIKEGEKTQILGPNQRIKKTMEHYGDSDTNRNWRAWNDFQRLVKGAGRSENWRMCRDHSNYSNAEVGQNTEKCSGDLRRLAVTQTPVKDHQLTLM